jgi:hypothetical protein
MNGRRGRLVSKDQAEKELRKFYQKFCRDYASAVKVASAGWAKRRRPRVNYRRPASATWKRCAIAICRSDGEIALSEKVVDIRRFLYEVETAREFIIIEVAPGASTTQTNSPLKSTLHRH